MTPSTVVLVVAADDVQAVQGRDHGPRSVRVFAEADALVALDAITTERPGVVVLGRTFAHTSRGALLVNAIRKNDTLSGCQVRVLDRAEDYLHLLERQDGDADAPDTVGDPLPSDDLGTRQAARHRLHGPVPVTLNGTPTTLIDLSTTGACVLGATALRLGQQVRLGLGAPPDVVRCTAVVVWVSFEPQGAGPPRYRAGVRFGSADTDAIEALCTRYRQS